MSKSDEVIEIESTAVVLRERSSVLLMPVMDVNTAIKRLDEFQAFCAHYLQESKDGGNDGGDYGIIPGTKKKTLLKSGADKLCEVYGLYDEYIIKSTIDWERKLFDYELTCVLKSRRDDSVVGSGVGSCSSYESKYLWRDAKRQCPKCGKPTIIKGQEQYGGGWVCWFKDGKSDGCKAKFADNDKSITDQIQGRVENPDIIDVKNTVLKMAKKRAKIDAVIGVTRSSGIFTQDMEDVPMPPAKPPIPVTEADIPLQPRSAGGNTATATTQEGAVKPAETNSLGPAQTDASAGKATAVTASPAGVPPAAMPPPLPPVEELAKQAKASLRKPREPKTPEPPKPTGEARELPGCIQSGQAINFAVTFKQALRPVLQKDASQYEHDFLKAQGIIGPDGEGTAYAIRADCFFEVRDEAERYAKTL